MFSRTSLASWDFFTITSLSLTAVCILLTLDWFLWATARVGTGQAQSASSPHQAQGATGHAGLLPSGSTAWGAAQTQGAASFARHCAGDSEPAPVAMSHRATHGAHGQWRPWLLGE